MNDKQFDSAAKRLLITFGILVMMAWLTGVGLAVMSELDKPTAPTYHCDGPGYPAPGTAEARACWIEESK
jgi:hypothetical protein